MTQWRRLRYAVWICPLRTKREYIKRVCKSINVRCVNRTWDIGRYFHPESNLYQMIKQALASKRNSWRKKEFLLTGHLRFSTNFQFTNDIEINICSSQNNHFLKILKSVVVKKYHILSKLTFNEKIALLVHRFDLFSFVRYSVIFEVISKWSRNSWYVSTFTLTTFRERLCVYGKVYYYYYFPF